MKVFLYLVFILATIISLLTQSAATPIPSAAITQLDDIQLQSADTPNTKHALRSTNTLTNVYSTATSTNTPTPAPDENLTLRASTPSPYSNVQSLKHTNVVTNAYSLATSTSTPTPTPADPLYEQTGNKTKETVNAPWAETHTTALIVLFTFMPLALCLVLYPIFRYLALRKAARLAKKTAKPEEKARPPGSPPSSYVNNPRLVPLPSHPEMVYVPPTPKNGTVPIFGHFRSPSGHVYGVTDRWVMAKGGTAPYDPYRSHPNSVFVYPV